MKYQEHKINLRFGILIEVKKTNKDWKNVHHIK